VNELKMLSTSQKYTENIKLLQGWSLIVVLVIFLKTACLHLLNPFALNVIF